MQQLTEPQQSWLVHRDLYHNESTLEEIKNEGSFHIEEIDLTVTDNTSEWYRFKTADFSSPSAEVQAVRKLERRNWSIYTRTRTVLTADAEKFYLDVNAVVQLCAQTAAAIEQYADRLAAHIAALGGIADGTLDTVAEHSGLNAYPRPVTRDIEHIDAVASALAVTVISLRSESAAIEEQCDGQTSELLLELATGLESHRAALQT